MKKLIFYIVLVFISVNSCIDIEDEPMVFVEPSVVFQGHVRNDSVYVTARINANPDFIEFGNIPTLFGYSGDLELYDMRTGELLSTEPVTGDGLSAIVAVSAKAESIDDIMIIASGMVTVSADVGSDGSASNDLLLDQGEFYEESSLSAVVNFEDFPIVTMDPTVDFQTYVLGGELHSKATIRANSTFFNVGAFPVLFGYSGVIQVYDGVTGALVKSRAITGSGLSNSVTIAADIGSYQRFVIIASGEVTCTGDIDSNGVSPEDIFISLSKFHEVLTVDLTN